MQEDMILEKLKGLLPGLNLQIDADAVTPASMLAEDLGIDSLRRLLLAVLIEDAFGIEFDVNATYVTVQDVVDSIARSCRAR